MPNWKIFTGSRTPHDRVKDLPPPPPWRDFDGGPPVPAPSDTPLNLHQATAYRPTAEAVEHGQRGAVPAPSAAGHRPARHREVLAGLRRRPRAGAGAGAALADHQPHHAGRRPLPLRRRSARARTPAEPPGRQPVPRTTTSGATSGSVRSAPPCSPTTARACCSSTRSTRATSTCPTTCSPSSRRASTTIPELMRRADPAAEVDDRRRRGAAEGHPAARSAAARSRSSS